MLEVRSPASGEILARLPVDDAATLERKHSKAQEAWRRWAAEPLALRIACLERFGDALIRERERLARTLCTEVGKPIREARSEIDGTVSRVRFFVEVAPAVLADTEVAGIESGTAEHITYPPLGVVTHLSAWNYPWYVATNVLVPALLAGNAVLYKPSELATLSGRELVRLLHEAGVPAEVLALAVGDGAVGAALLEHRVDGIFFTGSHATGKKVALAAARQLARVQLELGGKDPVYVCDDVDPVRAAESVAEGAFGNAGQSCCAVERAYVHEAVYALFLERLLEIVQGYRLGDPADEATELGPLTRDSQCAVLEAQVADAVAKGAVLHCGGRRLPGPGSFFAPTLLTEVDHTMELMREESFGPVLGIQRVGSDAEAQRLMDDTRYGLTAGVYTRDEARARRVLAGLRTGSAYWNCCDRVSPRLPWSGVRDSGLGVTLSTQGLLAFTRPRGWHMRPPA